MGIWVIKYEGEELYSARYDHIFKALFTSSDKTLLASFLSSVLNVDITVDGVTVQNAEVAPGNERDKRVRLDVRARVANGGIVNIEMQANNESNMGKRSIYHLSRLMAGQLESGEDERYETLCPTIAINVLDFNYLKRQTRYISRFRMKEVENNTEMRDAEYFEIIFIELPKLPEDAGCTMIELWVRFFSAETEEELKMLATQSPIMEKAVNRLREISADADMRYLMDMRLKDRLDRNSERFESRMEGRAEERTKIVKNMRAEGCDNKFIAKITKLPLAEIERIGE